MCGGARRIADRRGGPRRRSSSEPRPAAFTFAGSGRRRRGPNGLTGRAVRPANGTPPWLIHRRTGHANLHVRGYKENGTTTTPSDMVVRNDLDRYRLVMDVIDSRPRPARHGGSGPPAHGDTRLRHHARIREHGTDLPEVADWTWQDRASPGPVCRAARPGPWAGPFGPRGRALGPQRPHPRRRDSNGVPDSNPSSRETSWPSTTSPGSAPDSTCAAGTGRSPSR
ncbi:hypothetical protein [Streptomyces sp. IBSBF 2435]|uniref:phosphoketolase family protein n=1 Tax=Streptomyces sp. IBSBF 2435 TaxID=2903531 RepID=UPI002FDBCD56